MQLAFITNPRPQVTIYPLTCTAVSLADFERSKPRFGNAVTVVEMDGEIDMDNMEEQLKEPGLGRAVRLRSRCCAEPNEGWTTPRQNVRETAR